MIFVSPLSQVRKKNQMDAKNCNHLQKELFYFRITGFIVLTFSFLITTNSLASDQR